MEVNQLISNALDDEPPPPQKLENLSQIEGEQPLITGAQIVPAVVAIIGDTLLFSIF